MIHRRLGACIAASFLLCFAAAAQRQLRAGQDIDLDRFQSQIEAYLESDKLAPPPKQGILFIGSSIFRQWTNLTSDMAPLPVFNRAFGGSRTIEILHYMDKIVLPYQPAMIVYYCGSNDINNGENADTIAARFREFAARVHKELPGTRIFFVSINRAPQKQDRWGTVDEANRLVRGFCEKDKRLGFIDVNPALFDSEGRPKLDLYQEDGLHFKPQAYAEFTAIIKPVLQKAWTK
jgi:lysophospholipase L1-like esterase